LALSGAEPTINTTSFGTAPLVVGGVEYTYADACPITTVAEDTLVTFTTAGSVACPEGDFSRSAPIYNNAVASGCVASIMGVAVSIRTSGVSIYVASACSIKVVPGLDWTALGATISIYGVRTTTDHAASPMGDMCTLSSIWPFTDTVVITDRTPPVGVVAVPTLLPLGEAPTDPWCLVQRVSVFLGTSCKGVLRLGCYKGQDD
jgi:hypothetical protein